MHKTEFLLATWLVTFNASTFCAAYSYFSKGKRSTETRWKGSSWAEMEGGPTKIRLKLDECIPPLFLFASFHPYSQDKYFTHKCSSAEFLETVKWWKNQKQYPAEQHASNHHDSSHHQFTQEMIWCTYSSSFKMHNIVHKNKDEQVYT